MPHKMSLGHPRKLMFEKMKNGVEIFGSTRTFSLYYE